MKKILSLPALAATLLTLVCSCGRPSLLADAEALALDDPDSAAVLLAQVDTARLRAGSRALYHLTRALIDEERWQRRHADTASCLFVTDEEWKFFTADTRVDDAHLFDGGYKADTALYETFRYYERASLGGTSGDRTALRRFGRICYALSRHFGDQDSLLQADQLFHLAIHCAEAADDHATAYRAYDLMGRHQDYSHNDRSSQYWCTLQALAHFDRQRDHPLWLLRLVNDYGYVFLVKSGVNPTLFPLLARAAANTAGHLRSPMAPAEYDAVFQLIDSVRNAPADITFAYPRINSTGAFSNGTGEPYKWQTEVAVPIPMYEEAREMAAEKGERIVHPGWAFKYDIDVAVSKFQSQQRTYLAPGYVLKASVLQRRLLVAVITLLLLFLVLLVIVFWNSRQQMRRRHEAEQAERQREAERLAEQLRQKDAMIAVLRGHIIDKSEILEMLAPREGKRTLINARNWREIEMTLDMADNFVSRLRSEHPGFSEDDIRLCMLTRLRLSNTALSAIYVISVSAVQHRKQKLKKEGFGVTDPTVTLDQLIANY